MASPLPISTIPLVYLHSTPATPTPGLDAKESYFLSPGDKTSGNLSGTGATGSDSDETVVPRSRRTSFGSWTRNWSWSWSAVETVVWAAVPPLFFAAAFVLLCTAMFTNSPRFAYFSVVQKDGTGRLDYYVFQACAVASGSTERMCTPIRMVVNFLPALTTVSPSLLGFSALQLPFHSRQTPSIFLSSLLFLAVAALVYIPLWTLAYFPRARWIPRPIVRLARYSAARLFATSGTFALLSFLFTLTIGVGYLLQAEDSLARFTAAYQFGALSSPLTVAQAAKPRWTPQVGEGFRLAWAACAFSGLAVLAVKVSVHNGMDERVEWPADEKR